MARSASRRRLAVLAGSLVSVAAVSAPAPPAGAAVSTDPSGATVVLVRARVWAEVRPASGDRPPGCLRRWVETDHPFYLRRGRVPGDPHRVPMPPRPSPAHRAYHVFCDGDYVTSVWLVPSAFGGVDLRVLVDWMVRHLPYPPAGIGVSPEGRGLTGLESWFWVTGYRGEPIRDAVEGFGFRVEVEAVPAEVRWSFGDGTPDLLTPNLGEPPPARSLVTHTYETRRDGAGFEVRAVIRLAVRWRLDGGPWQAADPVLRVASRTYPVGEARSVLVP
jgi:hypothetical protein